MIKCFDLIVGKEGKGEKGGWGGGGGGGGGGTTQPYPGVELGTFALVIGSFKRTWRSQERTFRLRKLVEVGNDTSFVCLLL